MRFFDAHNHLQDERFADHETLIAACCCEGVVRMVVNGAAEEDWPAVAQLARKFPEVLPSFGYHPWYIHDRTPDWQATLVKFLDEQPAAIGEVGLDRWKPGLSYAGQEEVFLAQLRLAAERNLPISIHCLQAWGRLHELLRDNPRPACGFLLHSYGGSKEMVGPLAKLGAYFSFLGYFAHERKAKQRDAFQAVPRERLLIETDAPDQLPPDHCIAHPLHDSSGNALNHPANLPRIYAFVAAMLGERIEKLAADIEENFLRLFGGILQRRT